MRINRQLRHYLGVRDTIRRASGESLDLKAYEADMRHLINTYIEADEPRRISPFDAVGLIDLIVKTGIANAIATQLGGLRGNKDAIAETIENNVRRKGHGEEMPAQPGLRALYNNLNKDAAPGSQGRSPLVRAFSGIL